MNRHTRTTWTTRHIGRTAFVMLTIHQERDKCHSQRLPWRSGQCIAARTTKIDTQKVSILLTSFCCHLGHRTHLSTKSWETAPRHCKGQKLDVALGTVVPPGMARHVWWYRLYR